MNYKAINEFGFRRIKRIKQILEGVIHLGPRPPWITPSSISLILHILQPHSLIANYNYFLFSNLIYKLLWVRKL